LTRLDEEQLAELTGLDHLGDRAHRGAVEERVSAHQHELAFERELDQLERMLAVDGKRLLHERVLTRLQAATGELMVGVHGRGQQHRVHARVVEDIVERGRSGNGRVAAAHPLGALVVPVADPSELSVRLVGEHAHEVGAPVAQSDHRNARRLPAIEVTIHSRLFLLAPLAPIRPEHAEKPPTCFAEAPKSAPLTTFRGKAKAFGRISQLMYERCRARGRRLRSAASSPGGAGAHA
jgi:hypothetical protein